VSEWGERPTWVRHAVYWAIALGIIALTAFDGTTSAVSARSGDVESLAWFVTIGLVLAIMGLVFTLTEWEQIGAARNISRSLVLFTFLLGFVAVVLFYARRWGVHIEAHGRSKIMM
jgi:RsiW-degrading membrane proteinase PrsW (M82 family)